MATQLQGKLTRVSIGIMPDELTLATSVSGLLVPPPDVTVALSGAVSAATQAQQTAGVQTIGVAALSGPIGKGTCLAFESGNIVRRVTLVDHAKTGDTTLRVYPLVLAIDAAAVADHRGLLQLKGGKKADFDIKAEDESVMTFTDLLPGEIDYGTDGFKTGAIKSKEWMIAYEALTDPTDIGYDRMANAGASGSSLRVYCRVMLPIAPGFSAGETYEGVADLVGWKQTLSAENFVSYSTEIKGRGACKRTPAVQAA